MPCCRLIEYIDSLCFVVDCRHSSQHRSTPTTQLPPAPRPVRTEADPAEESGYKATSHDMMCECSVAFRRIQRAAALGTSVTEHVVNLAIRRDDGRSKFSVKSMSFLTPLTAGQERSVDLVIAVQRDAGYYE